MLISIVIPCYNASEYIERCFNSILKQIYDPLEIIFIDNKSTDNTYDKLLRLKENYPNIIVDQEHKAGATAARNKGLNLALGDWIQFLDIDDIILPQKLAHQVGLLKKCSYLPSFIASAYKDVYLDNTFIERRVDQSNNYSTALCYRRLGTTSSNLWNKNQLMDVGGWNESLKSCQEYELMFRLLLNGYTTLVDNTVLTEVYERETGSITKSNIPDNMLRAIQFNNRVYKSKLNTEHVSDILLLDDLFIRIKNLYNFNKSASIELHKQIIPTSYIPSISESVSFKYLKFYKIIGYEFTQLLLHYYTKIKDDLS